MGIPERYNLSVKKVLTCIATGLLVACLHAQNDTIFYLEEVEIVGSTMSRYSAGKSVRQLKGTGFAGSLQQIGNETAINFKTYGNGQLSTISLRGTAASHTQVMWNGLPVNSPTLGQTDFSVWPLFLADRVAIQKGSGGALFGSGSIGGSIIMDNSSIREDSLLTFHSTIGSFGRWDNAVKVTADLADNWRSDTRVFRGYIENNFPVTVDGPQIRQPNASVKRTGLSQRFNYSLPNHFLFSEVAFVRNDRQVQPTVTSASRDHLLTESLRAVLSDKAFIRKVAVFSTIGYAGETYVFNDSSITRSGLISGTVSADFALNNSITQQSGISYLHTWARSDQYEDTESDHQYHLFSSWSFAFSDRLRATVNLREALQWVNTVFVPAVGAEWTAIDKQINLTLKTQVSKGYRIPTFNDRFWRPGGNPLLKPERSQNYELGVDVSIASLKASLFSVTAFRSEVSNWIQWMPVDGIWTPRNIRRVVTRGIEAYTHLQFGSEQWPVSWTCDYELTFSSDKGVGEDNQLPYIPKHSLFSSLSVARGADELSIRANYTGQRFTTLSNSPQSAIEGFLLVDVLLFKQVKAPWASFGVGLSVNNVFNRRYENIKNVAMPGRNLSVELTINY